MPVVFAVIVSAVVTARTWVTPPVTPSASVVDMVCTESTTTKRRLDLVDVSERGLQIGFRGQVHVVVMQPVRSARIRIWPADSSPDRYSARRPASRPAVGDLEQQGRLADARIAGQKCHRAGHDAAAEHAVEFADAGVDGAGWRRDRWS